MLSILIEIQETTVEKIWDSWVIVNTISSQIVASHDGGGGSILIQKKSSLLQKNGLKILTGIQKISFLKIDLLYKQYMNMNILYIKQKLAKIIWKKWVNFLSFLWRKTFLKLLKFVRRIKLLFFKIPILKDIYMKTSLLSAIKSKKLICRWRVFFAWDIWKKYI